MHCFLLFRLENLLFQTGHVLFETGLRQGFPFDLCRQTGHESGPLFFDLSRQDIYFICPIKNTMPDYGKVSSDIGLLCIVFYCFDWTTYCSKPDFYCLKPGLARASPLMFADKSGMNRAHFSLIFDAKIYTCFVPSRVLPEL